jgi:asparagine synthase (glutamine-hydrolysing)
MCGLAGLLGEDRGAVEVMLDHIAHRGPDGRGTVIAGGATFGHVRLAVIDPTPASAQPYQVDGVTLTFNGEVWNYRELRARLEADGQTCVTTGDTEVLARWLARHGPAGLADVDGMFALAWADEVRGGVWLARDRLGEVPLHLGVDRRQRLRWASELKALAACVALRQLGPGQLVDCRAGTVSTWYRSPQAPIRADLDQAAAEVRARLAAGSAARAAAADVPACTLLSGGIDSAAITAELARHMSDLTAYTAVMDRRSRDLRCARRVADDLGVKLVEVPIPAPSADDLARVVAEIEQPHKAQVEIAWACLALADAMRADGFTVTYSGEGSDELWASYGMSFHGIAAQGWDRYRRRLVADQARKNFARANKVFMARGIEVRLPFCDQALTEYALALPQAAVSDGQHPKAVLCRAYADALDREVVTRPKVAFQDGLGLKRACASAVANPERFYWHTYQRAYGRRLAKGTLP